MSESPEYDYNSELDKYIESQKNVNIYRMIKQLKNYAKKQKNY